MEFQQDTINVLLNGKQFRRMGIEKVAEVAYKFDLFAANPTWRTNSGYHLNTWKSFIGTILILLASFGLAYDSISMLWIPMKDLPVINQYNENPDDSSLDSYWVILRFQNAENLQNIVLTVPNGEATIHQRCPESASGIDGWKVCATVSSRSTPFDPFSSLQTITFSIFIQNMVNTRLSVYMEEFSLDNCFLRSTVRLTKVLSEVLVGVNYDVRFSKGRVYISDGLLRTDYYSIVYTRPDKVYLTSYPPPGVPLNANLQSLYIGVSYSGEETKSYYKLRTPFIQIISNYLAWVQFLIAAMLVFFIAINNTNSKVQLCKALFENQLIMDSKVSVLFSIKCWLLIVMKKLKLVRIRKWLRSKGCLLKEQAFLNAEEILDMEVEVERILKNIENAKSMLGDKEVTDKQVQFDYQLEVETEAHEDSMELLVQDRRLKNLSNMEKVKYKMHPIVGFIKSFDAGSAPVEFSIDKAHKSSLLSIGITYTLLLGLIILLNYMGTFSFAMKLNKYQRKVQMEHSAIWNFNDNPLRISRLGTLETLNSVSAKLVIDGNQVGQLQLTQSCPQFKTPFRQAGLNRVFCIVNESVRVATNSRNQGYIELYFNFSSKTPEYRVETLGLSLKGLQSPQGLVREWDLSTPGNIAKFYEFTPLNNGIRDVGLVFQRNPVTTINTKIATSQLFYIYRLVIQLGQFKVFQADANVDFFESCDRAWSLTIMLGMFLIYVISKPYNKSVARKALLSHSIKTIEQTEKVLDTSRLILYLRAKQLEMKADARFFKKMLEQDIDEGQKKVKFAQQNEA